MLQTANFFLVISFLMRMTLAITFLTSALPKLRQPHAFASAVTAYRLLPKPWIRPVATILPWLELSLGLLLFLGWGTKFAAGISVGLLFLFLSAMGINLARGRKDLGCGCSGNSKAKKVSGKTICRNLIFILTTLPLIFWGGGIFALDNQSWAFQSIFVQTGLLENLLPLIMSVVGFWLVPRLFLQTLRLVMLTPVEEQPSEIPESPRDHLFTKVRPLR